MLILSTNCTWMESLTTRLSPAWHSWSFQKYTNICLTWSWALHCHAVNSEWESHPFPEEPEVRLYFTNCTRLYHCWLLHYVTMKPTHSLPRTLNLKCRNLQLIEVCTLTWRRRHIDFFTIYTGMNQRHSQRLILEQAKWAHQALKAR